MPQRITCHECHYVLYEGVEFTSPDKIIHQYTGLCPKCNRLLSFLPLTVEVNPANK